MAFEGKGRSKCIPLCQCDPFSFQVKCKSTDFEIKRKKIMKPFNEGLSTIFKGGKCSKYFH